MSEPTVADLARLVHGIADTLAKADAKSRAEARADALRDAAAAVEGLPEPTYDGDAWASSEQHGWETHEVAALAAIRALGERP